MRQALALVLLLPLSLNAQEVSFGPGMDTSNLGGLMIMRQNGQTTFSLGGILVPRHVKQKTLTPEGVVVTRFKVPAVAFSPNAIPFVFARPASVLVEIPDEIGLLYVDGELLPTKGLSRTLESPPLPSGTSYSIQLRGVFARGDVLLIEDRTLTLRAGESINARFDGAQAVAVPLPKDAVAQERP